MGVNSLSLSVGVGADVDSSPSDALSVLALRSSPRSVVLGAPPGPKGHVQSHNTPSHTTRGQASPCAHVQEDLVIPDVSGSLDLLLVLELDES